jgi:hypothetical protein
VVSSVAVRNAQADTRECDGWEDFGRRLPAPVEAAPWVETIDEKALVAEHPVVASINSRIRRGTLRSGVDLLKGYVQDDSAPELTDAVGRMVSELDAD